MNWFKRKKAEVVEAPKTRWVIQKTTIVTHKGAKFEFESKNKFGLETEKDGDLLVVRQRTSKDHWIRILSLYDPVFTVENEWKEVDN